MLSKAEVQSLLVLYSARIKTHMSNEIDFNTRTGCHWVQNAVNSLVRTPQSSRNSTGMWPKSRVIVFTIYLKTFKSLRY